MVPADKIVDFSRYQDAKQKLLERLYREHGDAVRSFLFGRTRVGEDVDDLVHDVFVRLARSEDLLSRSGEAFRTNRAYMFSIANNLLVDRLRQQKVRQRYQQEQQGLLDQAQEISPEIIARERQQLQVVERAIMSLPPVWRKAFVMSRFKYMSYKEIAEEMDVSWRSVEKYIANALVKIRSAVARESGEEK